MTSLQGDHLSVHVSDRRRVERDPPRLPERRHDIDLLRVLAAVSVVVLHTSSLLLADAINDREAGPAHWVGLVADTTGRFAVPAFFAISGWSALVASPPKNGAVLMRRVVRIAVPLAVWSAIYLLWSNLLPSGVQPPRSQLAVNALFGSVRPAFHLWYLYAYLPLLLLLGCASLIRAGQSFRLPGALLLVFALLPTCAEPLAVLTGWQMPGVGWGVAFYQVVYAVGGAALLSRRATRKRSVWLVYTLLGLGVVWWGHEVHFPAPYGTVAVMFMTLSVLRLISGRRIPGRAQPLVRTLAEASFGVYLFHLLLVQAAQAWLVSPASYGGVRTVAQLVVVSAAVTTISFGLSMLWGKVGLRRLLG